MIHTRICDLLQITHPIVLGGMATGTSASLVAAVSQAGGLGTLGVTALSAAQVHEQVAAIRAITDKPFGVNYLLFRTDEASFAASLEARPAVVSFAWARPEQDLRTYFQRVHNAGLLVMYMAGEVLEALRAAEAGADIIVAQGTEGGGHVGWMASMALVPMVVSAVAPRPVLAAGGIADGRGLVAALALGAEGVLLGTRFLATEEAPIHPHLKQAIVRSDGHDTVLTEIPDVAAGQVWPGAMARTLRNRFIDRWAGREWALRQHAQEVGKAAVAARQAGDVDEAPLLIGQDAGLIETVLPAGEVVRQMVAQAEEIITGSLSPLLRHA
ncbi:MAG TPA: nitronate monooxygenase [Candidatus Tectomicrobia bacterium]|jgi:NAD(P)H-dependent flavin oxidoreductase YrpB (nitropropane dioxygenase family)